MDTNTRKNTLYLPNQYAGPTEFCHLHAHTVYSILDGVALPSQYAEACHQRGYPAMAVTEHGQMASVPDMYFAFKKNKVKSIFGCELYYNDYETLRVENKEDGSDANKRKTLKSTHPYVWNRIRSNRHITVLAKNEVGFRNLVMLTTMAYDFGYYYKPRVWFEKLCEYKEGLIVLSGCLNGPVARELRLDAEAKATGILKFGEMSKEECPDGLVKRATKNRAGKILDKTAAEYVKQFREVFGEDYYIELQMPILHHLYDCEAFWGLINLADHYGIKTVLANDSHYMTREEFNTQKVMMAIEQDKSVYDPDLFHVNSDEQYMKTRGELWATYMNEYASGHSDDIFNKSCDNTLEVADKCEQVKFDSTTKIPDWKDIEGKPAESELRRIVYEELHKRGLAKNPRKYLIDGREVTYTEQAEIELNRFIDKGFASYFLITRDLIQYGKQNGWPFGPRGCAIPDSMIGPVGNQKRIEDIKIGDDIKDGFCNDQKVINKFVYDVAEELFVFEFDNTAIEVTADHKLYIIRDNIVMLLPASEIKDTDEFIGSLSGQKDSHVKSI